MDQVAGLGESLAIDGTTVVAGAPSSNGGCEGKAYVFTVGASVESAQLQPPDLGSCDGFATSVAIGGSRIVAGTLAELGGGVQGTAYLFTASGGNWPQTAKFSATSDANGLGASVAVGPDSLVLGAPDTPITNENGTYPDAGVVLAYNE